MEKRDYPQRFFIMSNLNSISSIKTSPNWDLPSRNDSPNIVLPNKKVNIRNNTSDASLLLTLSKIKNYVKRLGLALIGQEDKTTKLERIINSEIADDSINQDPLIGNWPSNFPASAFSSPVKQKPIANQFNDANEVNKEQEFKQMLEEVEQQKAALEIVKENNLGLNLN